MQRTAAAPARASTTPKGKPARPAGSPAGSQTARRRRAGGRGRGCVEHGDRPLACRNTPAPRASRPRRRPRRRRRARPRPARATISGPMPLASPIVHEPGGRRQRRAGTRRARGAGCCGSSRDCSTRHGPCHTVRIAFALACRATPPVPARPPRRPRAPPRPRSRAASRRSARAGTAFALAAHGARLPRLAPRRTRSRRHCHELLDADGQWRDARNSRSSRPRRGDHRYDDRLTDASPRPSTAARRTTASCSRAAGRSPATLAGRGSHLVRLRAAGGAARRRRQRFRLLHTRVIRDGRRAARAARS
jgi:hypothetical protein